MKLIANLLLTVSLVLGALSGATAYLVDLELPDAQVLNLTLNAVAGIKLDGQNKPVRDEKGHLVPLFQSDTTVTPQVLAQLRDADVARIKVKEFAFGRWRGKWLFLISVFGLGMGAYLIRVASRREIESASTAAGAEEADSAEVSRNNPHRHLGRMADILKGLLAELPEMESREGKLKAVVDRVGEIQKEHVPAFVECRTYLVGKVGLAGYAMVMDQFAGGERIFNRAWSAAADGVFEEAIICLGKANDRIADAQKCLIEQLPVASPVADLAVPATEPSTDQGEQPQAPVAAAEEAASATELLTDQEEQPQASASEPAIPATIPPTD